MARRTKEQAQQTREEILKGALNVFSEKGYSRATLNNIAKRISMTRGAIYWHFKDKQDLLIALMEAMHQREEELLEHKPSNESCLDNLRDQFMARADLLENHEDFRKFAVLMSLQVEWATEKHLADRVRGETMRTRPFRFVPQHLALAEEKGEIRPEVDLNIVEDILVGLFTGLVRHCIGGISKTQLDVCLKPALQAVLDSIRA